MTKSALSKRYSVEDGKVVKALLSCPRCGAGFFMAEHSTRYTCGHCGYTK
ncbi:MAG: 30S ribosomal protein S27ae, partial [Nitrososphaerota archaeon]